MTITLAPGIDVQLVHIPTGEFIMGEDTAFDQEAWPDEAPKHRVFLDEYWIGRYPITVAQFAAFVQATNYRTHPERNHWGYSWRQQEGEGDDALRRWNFPVVWINWQDANAFCQWAGDATGRAVSLPTEAQWEKAARGTDGRRYPWGDAEPVRAYCNYSENFYESASVGDYSPRGDSVYGCSDIAGNVREWCADWYDAQYYRHSPDRNPRGPDAGHSHVLRGTARCAERRFGSGHLAVDFGFRIVVEPDASRD